MGITIESLKRSTTHLQISDNDLDPSNDSSVAVENNSSRYEGPSRSDGVVGEGEVFIEDVNEGDVTEVNPQTAGGSLRIPSPEIEAEDMTSLMLEFEQEHRRKVRIVFTLR